LYGYLLILLDILLIDRLENNFIPTPSSEVTFKKPGTFMGIGAMGVQGSHFYIIVNKGRGERFHNCESTAYVEKEKSKGKT